MDKDDDCPITKADHLALQQEMRDELARLRDTIDQLKATKHTPFLGSLALFVVIWAALWNSQRALENEVDLIHIEIAVALQDAREFRASHGKDAKLHEAKHVRQQERYSKLVDIVLKEIGVRVESVE